MTPRTRLCLACRTALEPGEPGDWCPGEAPVPLDEASGRARLKAVVGETITERAPRLWLQVACSVGIAALILGLPFYFYFAVDGGVPLGLVVVGVVIGVIAIFRLMTAPLRYLREDHVLVLHGASQHPFVVSPRVTGVVDGPRGEEVARVLCGEYGDEVMFRDGLSLGFTLRVDDGLPIEVPAGRVRGVLGPQVEELDVETYAARLAEHHGVPRGEAALVAPTTRRTQWVLRGGDHVVLEARIEEVVEARADYRGGAKRFRRTTGLAWIQPVPPTDEA